MGGAEESKEGVDEEEEGTGEDEAAPADDERHLMDRINLDKPLTSSSSSAAGHAGRHGDHCVAADEEEAPVVASSSSGVRANSGGVASSSSGGGDPSAAHGWNGDGSQDVALKIFKLTLNEFRDRKAYMAGDRRYAKMNLRKLNPRKVIVAWAEKEFKNLVRIHRAGIRSPAPLLLEGNVMVMSFLGADGFPAPQLRQAALSRPGWEAAYRQTVALMVALYKWTHLVHADLSEYNL